MNSIKSFVPFAGIALVVIMFAVNSMAQTPEVTATDDKLLVEKTAHQVVEATTERIMALIVDARDYYDEEPQRFYGEIDLLLSEVVDFNSFSRGVMGKYASKKAYMSLNSVEEKKAFKARITRFSGVFQNGLVQTYAKGLLAFNGNKIKVVPPERDVSGNATVTVKQHIFGDNEKPYVVQYKMRKNREGVWKLRNVTIEAINLGKVYQGQFSSAVRLHHGDIDKVIENWTVEPSDESEAIVADS